MRGRKETYYICVGLNKDGKLCTLESEALTKVDAIFNFINKYDFSPDDVFGPFSARREGSRRKMTNVKFSTNSYDGIYNNWNVSVTELTSPKNYVFVLFNSTVDGSKQKVPNGEVVHFRHIQKRNL